MRLALVELARLRSRRAIAVLLAGAFVIGALVLGGVLWEHRPVPADELAAAQRQAAADAERPMLERQIRECEQNPRRFFGPRSNAGDCRQNLLPSADWYLNRPQLRPAELLEELPIAIALLAAVIAALVGATMIGAEWSAGSVGTQLLFEPRRRRVWAAKALVIAAVCAVMALAVYALVWAGILIAHGAWVGDHLRSGFTRDLAMTGLRVVAFTAVGGLAGYAITAAVRHTVVVVGLMLAYSVVGEVLFRQLWPPVEPWLVSNNAFAWIQDGFTVVRYPSDCFEGCRPIRDTITTTDAAVYFGVLAALALAISLLFFQRRDVP